MTDQKEKRDSEERRPIAFKITGPDVYGIAPLFEADIVGLRDALSKCIQKWGLRADPSLPPFTVKALFLPEKIEVIASED